jgi:WD40 repeat protein
MQVWLLAAGDSGGSIVVWDLATGHPISRCNGSAFNVYALAFSPDGMTLASAGRFVSTTILWDWASARPVLICSSTLSQFSGLAFSRDGRRLAVGLHFLDDSNYSRILLWDLEFERGIQVLRGLTAPVEWVLFSPDRRKIAALSHDWAIAVWDLTTGRLHAILNAPKGYTADNAGLALSCDGRQIAACAGREAKLWDIASGKELLSWRLPPGLKDGIAFGSPGQLLLYRCETLDGVHLPIGNDFTIYPRVCRIRNLLGPEPLRPLVELREFNRQVHGIVAVLGGRYFIVDGSHDAHDDQYSTAKAVDGTTGQEVWSIRSGSHDKHNGTLAIDGTGERVIVGIEGGEDGRLSLREVSTGKELRSLDHWPGSPSPDGKYFVQRAPEYQGISLHGEDDRRLLILGIDQRMGSNSAKTFRSDGKRVAWGNTDGSVMVADLDEVRARLAQVELNWVTPSPSDSASQSRAK